MKVEVVTSGTARCPSCERAKQLIRKVLQDFPDIEFGEIDSLEEPDRIQALGMVTSGAIVIDHQLAFSSLPKEKVLRNKIEERFRSSQAIATPNNHPFPLAGGGMIQLASEEAALTVPAGDKKIVLIGLGMVCSSCHDAVAATIEKTGGVKSFFVNTESNRATVVYDPKAVSIDQIKSNLSNTGYKADDVKEIQS